MLGVAGALLLAACSSESEGRPDEELGPLVISQEVEDRPIDVDEAARSAGELARALAMPHADVGEALGAHRVEGRSSITVREGDRVVEELEDEVRIVLDADGDYSATLDNSKDYGRHVFFVDGQLYLRPRYGNYHRRAPTSETEPATIRREIFGATGAYFELLAARAETTDGGARTVAGRDARVVTVATAAKARPRAVPTTAQSAWRAGATVEEVEGEVVLDAESGAPLEASIAGTVTFARDGRTFSMRIEAEHRVRDVGTADQVEPPPAGEVRAIPLQESELSERDALLEGIAPPARAAPTPANPDGVSAPGEAGE